MTKPSIIVIVRDLDPHLRNTLESALSQLRVNTKIVERDRSQVPRLEKNETLANKSKKRIREACSLIARGRFHLKHSGIRQSTRMGMTYLFQRTGREWFFSNRRSTRVTNEDLLAAMTILQQDLRLFQSNLTRPDGEGRRVIRGDEDNAQGLEKPDKLSNPTSVHK